MRADDTKTLLQSAFDAWSKGEGDFYRLVVDDVVWTIAGSSPMAGTYTSRQQFLDRAIHPIFQRLLNRFDRWFETFLSKVGM
jgi:uncharacterized protein